MLLGSNSYLHCYHIIKLRKQLFYFIVFSIKMNSRSLNIEAFQNKKMAKLGTNKAKVYFRPVFPLKQGVIIFSKKKKTLSIKSLYFGLPNCLKNNSAKNNKYFCNAWTSNCTKTFNSQTLRHLLRIINLCISLYKL